MMLQYFQRLASVTEARISKYPHQPNARKKFALEIAKLGIRLYSGEHRVAWCGVVAPFDVLSAMNVTSCFVEFVGAMLASTGTVGMFLEESEHAGFAADTCGYHRAVLGAAMKGMMPVPDIMIATTCPCSGGLAAMENLARTFKKELFVLDVPSSDTSESVRYLADQYKNMMRFVSDRIGGSIDEDRLRESIVKSNRARELMIEVYRLAQHVPSPANGQSLANFGIVMALFLGTDAGIEIAQAYKDEYEEMIRNGKSGVPDEKIRLLWLQNRIQFKHPLIRLLEEEYQAAIVIDELNDITWDAIDPDDPFTSIARRTITTPLNGKISQRLDHIQRLSKLYKVDGAVNPCHWGCRQGTGARGLIQAGLKEVGVPVVNLEVDCVDTRNFAEGQLRTRLEAFMEMLRSNPTAHGA
ncbi:MAG: 2-hydroxyacyl-CoA dehydratase [Desulfomonile tiedjei]|uniref:2-hydroxyacyl-CoA dehydratase n=1 Tax=Desulfomonile tiedjei TaxID=2358 RepID=A0A9D6V0J8_9BACT|nr:2-hydroxyacyl-CoA dehydratase [Desulfomonile tiedjei]